MTKHSPILITGCPRSGASIIAKAFYFCGAFIGDTTVMYENEYILEAEHNLLKTIAADVRGQNPLPDTNNLRIPTWWADYVRDACFETTEDKRWIYKSSLVTLLWPIWKAAFPDAKWIIVRRRTGDIINSCEKTTFMNGYSKREDWLNWIHQYEQRFIDMIDSGIDHRIVWPDRMVSEDYDQLQEAVEWTGLRWSNSVKSIIDPLLWHSRKKEKEENKWHEQQ